MTASQFTVYWCECGRRREVQPMVGAWCGYCDSTVTVPVPAFPLSFLDSEEAIEATATAIYYHVAPDDTEILWPHLPDWARDGYREQARAALSALKARCTDG